MNSVSLEKGIVHLMLPFRLCSGFKPDFSTFRNDVWTETKEDIPKLDFLLEHVKAFFAGTSEKGETDESACIILKLKPDSVPVKIFNNKIFWQSNVSFEKQQKGKSFLKLPVYIDPYSFRIVLHPFTRIALLTYSIELVSENRKGNAPKLNDFIRMNYLLRLFNRHDEAFFISQNERPEERSKARHLEAVKTDMFHREETNDIIFTGWRPSQLINFLLQDLNNRFSVELFDHYHFSSICYVQPSDELTDGNDINHTLFYLRKVYDFDYSPADGVLQREDELIHPYRQIYYASSLEGAVVLNNSGKNDPEFLKTFYFNSFQKTLWLTILGFMQRTIFLQLMKEVSEINPSDHQMVKEYLRRYTTISLKAIFSKVSVFHQHNDYYDLIIHNLHIRELQAELKEELHELNNMLRQQHEDEVERYDELEKLHDKRLNMILFALSVFGLTEIIYSVTGAKEMSLGQHALALGIPVIIGIVFWQIIIKGRK